MKKKIWAGVIFVILAAIAVLAYFQEPSNNQKLKGQWTHEFSQQINDSLRLQTTEEYQFTENFTFVKTIKNELGIQTSSGLWRINDNLLVMTMNYEVSLDSAVYKVVSNSPEIIYYKDGETFTTLSSGNISNVQKLETLTILDLNAETIHLSNVDKTEMVLQKMPDKNALIKVSQGFNFSFRSIFRGIIGILFLIGIAYVFSNNRRAISWRVVGIGLAFQIILAFSILKIPAVAWIFETAGKVFVVILDFTREGSEFLLGSLMDASSYGFIFAFQVLPTIIFFSALTSLFFYLGIIQKVVYYLALVMTKLLGISGAESLSVAGNIFLGQTESPLMIKAYLDKMNRSEMLLVMSGGMATLAGGVLAAYIAFLGGDDPVQKLLFAKHLLAASVMAAPGVIVLSKILIPQTENIDLNVVVSKEKIGSNVLDAISNGTTEGLKLAANVAAMLLTFIAMIALTNFVLMKLGSWTGLNAVVHSLDPQYDGLDLKFILGYIFAPIVWVMGVVSDDITLVGRLLGEKIIMTEFIAYVSLADLKSVGDAAYGSFASEKSIIMATYALCGFANFASIGIQIGGIGTLAPNRRKMISELGFRALLAGSLASLVSATIVGMLMG
ncbi:MAG: nucleoside transporter C-terminal domain-containing protein [Bacteroidales bacterium]|nr:nucleoside transporter C-terminal domain-containing protein [Bacteroidales bacterium]